jgi:hypothetical protein
MPSRARLVVSKNNTVPIQAREASFQSGAVHLPASLGLPDSRLPRLDSIIPVVLHWVLILRCQSYVSMPARPVYEVEQRRPIIQKGMVSLDQGPHPAYCHSVSTKFEYLF